MRTLLLERRYAEAVTSYKRASPTLERYGHFPFIKTIEEECSQILSQLKDELYGQLSDIEINTHNLVNMLNLLIELNESPNELAAAFLAASRKVLNNNLDTMREEILNFSRKNTVEGTQAMDVLEFMDLASNGFLSSLSTTITSYKEIFIRKLALSENIDDDALVDSIKSFVGEMMAEFFEQIKLRLSIEPFNTIEIALFVRALDRMYRRLEVLTTVFGYYNFTTEAYAIIWESSSHQWSKALELIKTKFSNELVNARHGIVSITSSEAKDRPTLSDILVSLETTLSESVKEVVKSLEVFIGPELSYLSKTNFRDDFILEIREKIVVAIIKHVIILSSDHCKSTSSGVPLLVLLLSRLNLDLDVSMITYLINFTEEQLFISRDMKPYPHLTQLRQATRESAQNLINCYVRLEGHSLSQMIKKSVETRDWSSGIEPRAVRSVMKRVVEDVSLLDSQVGHLYEEGSRADRSSESSRSRTNFSAIGFPTSKQYPKSSWSSYGANSIDNSLISNIQKLFSEKIEIFSPVEFTKLSIATGVIKIGLKTFLECVRLSTFSKYGLQQVQVDGYYLQTHLWRFVTDEKLVQNMIEEVLRSAIIRCIEPTLMEMSIVDKICEGR
ncbi:vacuolar protein sorting-associated protein 51 homolog [Brevipalpus obovatus]